MLAFILIYGKDSEYIATREVCFERNELPAEMKKAAKDFKEAVLLKAKMGLDMVVYDIKKKEFIFNAF